MKKRILLLLTLPALALTSCDLFNRGPKEDPDFIPKEDLTNVPFKTVEIAYNNLETGKIPTSYTSSGVEFGKSDLKLFGNYITHDYAGGISRDSIFLKQDQLGFIKNTTPILELDTIEFIGESYSCNVYASKYHNREWKEIDKVNGKYRFEKDQYYFAITSATNKPFGFNTLKIHYKKTANNIKKEPYIIKDVAEIDKNTADSLIHTSTKSFTNSSKWQNLGYAKDINEAKANSNLKLQSGFNGKADYQTKYNPDLVIASNGMSYRLADMEYGDNGDSFRINMIDGSEGPVIYKDGIYTYVEDIAAYMTAFGDAPKNMRYSSKGNGSKEAIKDWGKNGRINYTSYSNDNDGYKYQYETEVSTHRYLFEPAKNSSNYWYNYYESDYGASNPNNEPYQLQSGYDVKPYNNGSTITRGALRFVWSYSYTNYEHSDKVTQKIDKPYDRNIFYTSTHYNDFQQYLNYYGGWSLRFGNTTLGNMWGDYNSNNHLDSSPEVLITSLNNIRK